MSPKGKGRPAAWWKEATTLTELVQAKSDLAKLDFDEKFDKLKSLKESGAIGQPDFETSKRRLEMVLENNKVGKLLELLKLSEKDVKAAESGAKPLSKAKADEMAAMLGCPPNVIYAVAQLEGGDAGERKSVLDGGHKPRTGVTFDINTSRRGSKKPKVKSAQVPERKKPGPKPSGGRPVGSGKNQRAAKSLEQAMAEMRPAPGHLLVGLTRKKALEKLAQITQVQSYLFSYLASQEAD